MYMQQRSTLFEKAIVLRIIIVSVCFSLVGCSSIRYLVALLRSTDHFIPHSKDPRVLYEPGAKTFADYIVPLLPEAIEQVESGHYRLFTEPAKIYVCASRDSFYRLYGARVKAGVSNKLLLSPRLMSEPENIRAYLAHELSHLHLYQQLGRLKMKKLPFWFKEGLATLVSEGGGAQKVSEMEAINSIRAARHFIPNRSGGLFSQKTAVDWGLHPHMFYRQSMMFVAFLRSANERGFRAFLLKVQDGDSFAKAFEEGFSKGLDGFWEKFLEEIKMQG